MSTNYTNIIEYISNKYDRVATLIDVAAAKLLLTSLKGKNGITFLVPNNQFLLDKLQNLANSMDPDDHVLLHDHIAAMTLQHAYKTEADWRQHAPVNSLYPPQLIKIRSVSSNEITFENGAVIKRDDNFVDNSPKKCLAIWTIESGEIPITTDRPAQLTKNNKVGSYQETYVDMNLRNKICIAIENKYALQRLKYTLIDNDNIECDAYIHAMLSIVNYIVNVAKNVELFKSKVLPLISLNKIDIYFIIEPHRISGTYLLDDNIIQGWWSQKSVYSGFNCSDILKYIQQSLSTPDNSCALYSSRSMLFNAINTIRKSATTSIQSNPRKITEVIYAYYDTLENSNVIGNIENVLPSALSSYYKTNSKLKLLQDQLRYYTYMKFKDIESSMFNTYDFNELVNYIGECLRASTLDEINGAAPILNHNVLKYLINPNEYLLNINTFINSTMLLFIPMTYKESCELKQKNMITLPNPASTELYNINRAEYEKHSRIINLANNAQNNEDLLKMLANLDLSKVDDELRQAIMDKFK